MTDIKVVTSYKHFLEFDVQNLPPKNAVVLNATMEFDVETLRVHTVNIGPQTNTVMDPKQWAQRIGQIPLDSRHVNEFKRVNECDCESGGPCCNAEIQLHLTNDSERESLNVYTDDLVATDRRVRPVHRTFKVATFNVLSNGSIEIQTTEEHTFSDGELVNVIDANSGVAPFWRAKSCNGNELVIVPLFSNIPTVKVTSLNLISNRQLLYVLGPNQTISFKATATKGSGRDWVKWSPCWSFYRPLFRDNAIDRTKKLTAEQAKAIKDSCPKQIFDIEWVHNLIISRPDDCDACRQCAEKAAEIGVPGVVQLSKRKKPEWQRFAINSFGSMNSVDILRRAIEIILFRLRSVAVAAQSQLLYPSLSNKNKR